MRTRAGEGELSSPLSPSFSGSVRHAAGRGDFRPLVRPLDVVEGEQFDGVGPEGREYRPQFRRGIGLGSPSELDADDDKTRFRRFDRSRNLWANGLVQVFLDRL
jgi:hypothetical protein